MNTRSRKILHMACKDESEPPPANLVFLPKYESTKGLSVCDRNAAIDNWDDLSLISEDKSSGSEYIPSTSTDSGDNKREKKEWWHIEPTAQEKVSEWLQKADQNEKVNEKNGTKQKRKKPIKRNAGYDFQKEEMVMEKKGKIKIIQDINIGDYLREKDEKNVQESHNDLRTNCMKQSYDALPAELEECRDDITIAEDTIIPVPGLLKYDNNANMKKTKMKKVDSPSAKKQSIVINEAQKINGRRIRDKVHCCYFCMEKFLHMARHFEQVHSNEMSVAKVLAMEKHSSRRKTGFAEIIRAGDFNHNCEVMCLKSGELILVRRPTEKESKFVSYEDYGPCPHCLGFMMKKHIWHHIKHCAKKTDKHLDYYNNKNVIAESEALLNQVYGGELPESFLQEIVSKIRRDEIGICCRNDTLIMKYGSMLFEKYHLTQSELIRQSMRQLGRLVLNLREISKGNISLADILKPDAFDLVVKATKKLCISQVANHKRPEFEMPSLALKIGYALKKCASIERGTALRKMDLKRDNTLTSFLNIMELEWSIKISSNALSTLYKRKMNQTQLLPLTSDLIKLNKCITENIIKSQMCLKQICTTENWQDLAVYTLGRIILFNKRRSGEAAKMTIENFKSKPSWTEQSTEEIKHSLTPFEKKLTEKLTIVEIEGKRGRKVAVLLTEETKISIELLIETRVKCDVLETNPYIFAASKKSMGHLRGHDCLAKICKMADLQNPQDINSTKLRKYIATVCQVFNLTENEHDWLARHLGHDIKVHREFYRLHESAVELTKVSRLLLAVDNGQASQFAGKTLDEIQIDDLPALEHQIEDDNESSPDSGNVEERASLGKQQEQSKTIPEKENGSDKKGSSETEGEREQSKKKKKRSVPIPWTLQEKEAVSSYFKINIKNGIVPGKIDCEKCIAANDILKNRDWRKVKFCVKNQIDKKKKVECNFKL